MTVWQDLPSSLRDGGALDPLRGPLSAVDLSGPTTTTEDGRTWTNRTATLDVAGVTGAVDPATGRIGSGGDSPIELAATTASLTLALRDAPGGGATDAWRLDLDVPGVRIRLPFLTGARLAADGMLEPDPTATVVRLLLPRLVTRLSQVDGGALDFELRSVTTSGTPLDDVYSAVEMSPPYALVGPGAVVGFAFRSAVLDLSGTNGPTGVPAGARAMPGTWQGFYLPEARLFVAPGGLDGIAVSAGVRNLWIGLGAHAGVTGTFSAEVVNRGGNPTVLGRFITPGGRHVAAIADGEVEVPDGSAFVADSAGGTAPVVLSLTVDGATTTGDRAVLTVPATGAVSIAATARAQGGETGTATFRARRPAGTEAAGGAGANPATVMTLTPEAGRVVEVHQTASAVTVALASGESVAWSWPGGSTNGAEATIPVVAGADVEVTATRAGPSAPLAQDGYLRFDRPRPDEDDAAWSSVDANVRTVAATAHDRAPTGPTLREVIRARAAAWQGLAISVDGYASYEAETSHPATCAATHPSCAYNLALSRRRADAVVRVLTAEGLAVAPSAVTGRGHEAARTGTAVGPGPVPPPGDGGWWWVRVSATPAAPAPVRARLRRGVVLPVTDRDPAPPSRGRPDCFSRIGVEVEILRSTFVRCEVWGEFDIQTALESSLEQGGGPPLGGRSNDADGVCLFRVRLRVASDGGAWETFGEFRAHEGDLDGLVQRPAPDGTPVNRTALDMAGAFAVMGPISATVATLSPEAGALIQLGSVALGATGWLATKVLTLHGGELVISNGIIAPDGSSASTSSGAAAVMLDVEVQFTFDFSIISVPADKPIRTRYRAIGVRAAWDANGPALPVPVFDPARGYELDIQPGSLRAVAPLDEILRIFGVRVSRDNPTYLEIEAGIGVELGPVTIDTLRVRARLDAPEMPQLTKLGASIDIPGTVHGSGTLELLPTGFRAAFDITVVPLSIRAVASLAIETVDGVTGILIGIDVEFPVPLVLGSSGLGIFGLLGGVGINYARKENPDAALPALDWVTKQLSPPRSNVMHPDGWQHRAGSYAFAGGLLVGTLEGGFVVHLKGIILIEVPGPRLLLVMKADVLTMPPTLLGEQTATFLAVLDIDFGRGTITLGVVADYRIESILRVHVPVTAFFSTREPQTWRVDLGTYDDRVTVSVLDVLEASGYLMVHGDGITIPVLPPAHGLSIATGFHLQAVLMGYKPARLYVEVAAGFDAILGFDPFYLAGKIYARGELMLFIVSIGVSAELTLGVGKRMENGVLVDHPYVHGEVCGSVSFFFFDIEACLELTIGSKPSPDLQPRPLVAGLTLVGRSPALVEGSGTGHALDASLGEAPEQGVTPAPSVPVVPIDAIPVLTFSAMPDGTGLSILGSAPQNTSGVAGASAWQRIGDRWWAYRITAVTLTGDLIGDVRPSTWWRDAPTDQQATVPALALLTWLPTPFSRAIAFGETLTTSVEHRWGTSCEPAVPAQPQLWTFADQPLGPSRDGWRLTGVVWPDPPGAPRSTPAQRHLTVREPWRTGEAVADQIAGVDPARVVGDLVPCDTRERVDAAQPLASWFTGLPTAATTAGPAPSFVEATSLLGPDGTLADLPAVAHDAAADPDDVRGEVCVGRILRAPWGEQEDASWVATPLELEQLAGVRAASGRTGDRLADAVVLDLQESLVSARLLLVGSLEPSRSLLVVARDAQGNDIEVVQVDHTMVVDGGHPLPGTWVDVDGPWARLLTLAGRAAARTIAKGRIQGLYLVDLPKLDPATTSLAIGWKGYGTSPWDTPVHVVALEATTLAEVQREDWDTTVATADRDSLENGLTHDPDECALLTPGQTYSLAVTWDWDSETGEAMPTRAPVYSDAETQTFTFAAGGLDKSPRDLRPWLLDTDPGMGDTGLLCHEPMRVALAHQRVPDLFAAYGRRLEVTVLSASGHHPRPPGGGAPGAALVIPTYAAVLAGEDVLQLVHVLEKLPILSPWDAAVQAILGGLPCVPVDEVRRDGSVVRLGYELAPLTDHLLDIHSVPITGGGERIRVFRANFTTSRFRDLDHLASWILPTAPEHRLVRDPAPLAALGTRPSGDVWDSAVQRAGLPVPAVPDAPRVEIWWSSEAIPQPLGVVVECSEALLRERRTPVELTGPTDGVDPTHRWWGTGIRPWLSLEGHAGPDAGDVVTSGPVVVAPGGTRVLVRLAPGSRGRRLRLDLVHHADLLGGDAEERALAVDVTPTRAPWEVED